MTPAKLTGVIADDVGKVVQTFVDGGYVQIDVTKDGDDSYTVTAS